MQVTFQRTAERRYAIRADRPGHPPLVMDPAPGYDPLLPHDLLHLVVEAELGLTRGIFGQLAAGGRAGTFRLAPDEDTDRRRASRRRRASASRDRRLLHEGRDDSAVSERASYLCWHAWLARSELPERRRLAADMATNVAGVRAATPAEEARALDPEALGRICARLDALSARWSGLAVGEAMVVRWPDLALS